MKSLSERLKFPPHIHLVLALAFSVAACGGQERGQVEQSSYSDPHVFKAWDGVEIRQTESLAPPIKITVDSEHTEGESRLIHEAFDYLRSLEIRGSNTELQGILGIDTLTARSLIQFLEDRVQLIVRSELRMGTGYRLAHAETFGRDVFPNPDSNRFNDAGIVMINLGSSLYVASKHLKAYVEVNLPEQGWTLVRSPRIGILQVGPAFFPNSQEQAVIDEDYSARIHRLMTAFHEARHSDGNGRSLGFPHIRCPLDPPLEVQSAACERYLNGPYAVGAQIGRLLTETCAHCSIGNRELLRSIYLDDFSRLQSSYRRTDGTMEAASWGDITPEGSR